MNKSYYSGNNSVRIKQALLKRDVGHFLNPSFNRIKKELTKITFSVFLRKELIAQRSLWLFRYSTSVPLLLFVRHIRSNIESTHPRSSLPNTELRVRPFFPGCHSQPNPAFYFRMTKVSPFTLFRFRYWILLILLCVLAGTYAVCLQAFRLRTYGGELTIAALQLRVGIDFSFVFLS